MIKINKLDQALWEQMLTGTSEHRKFIGKMNFAYFAYYYFSEYMVYKSPKFHWDFYDDCNRMIEGEIDEVAWWGFRESAKTSIAKMFLVYCICYELEDYINWDSHDKSNAEQSLFDVATILQTNKKIINDFGMLFKDRKAKKKDDDPKMKRIGEFITENKIKVEAYSTQQSTRGRQFYDPKTMMSKRPGLYILDDFENNITIKSFPIMAKIKAHIDELKSGMGKFGKVLYLGNVISDEGVVDHVTQSLEGKPNKVVRDIPVVSPEGRIAWPDKYVKTNKEALEANLQIPDRTKWKISLEQKRADLGEKVYETEMMNNPSASGDYFFNREIVKRAMRNAREPDKNSAGFKTWGKFDPRHRYGGGADTSEGVGSDSSATVIFNFSAPKPFVVGTFESNQLPPNTFAHEIKRQGDMFGECFFIPEINNTGYATVAELVNLGYYNQYRREVKNKTTGKLTNEFGWRTMVGNKYDIAANFKTSFEDGEFEVYDMGLLKEMYHFTMTQMNTMKAKEGMTKHFDKLMAGFLAWEARKHATLSKTEKKDIYKSPHRKPYEL